MTDAELDVISAKGDLSEFAGVPVRMTRPELEQLRWRIGEYSCSNPTGVTPGKRWLRRTPFSASSGSEGTRWFLMAYGPAYYLDDPRKGRIEVCNIESVEIEVDE